MIPKISKFFCQKICIYGWATCLPTPIKVCSSVAIIMMTVVIWGALIRCAYRNVAIFLIQKPSRWHRIIDAMTNCCCFIHIDIKISWFFLAFFSAEHYWILSCFSLRHIMVISTTCLLRGLHIAIWNFLPNVSFCTNDTSRTCLIIAGVLDPFKMSILIQPYFDTFAIIVCMTE